MAAPALTDHATFSSRVCDARVVLSVFGTP